MDSPLRSFRQALRALAREPLLTAVTIVTLALGIGATTAIFSVVDQVLLAPLPYRAPDRLVAIRTEFPALGDQATYGLSEGQLFTFQRQARDLALLGVSARSGATLEVGDEPRRIWTARVSADLFSALGVQPAIGRGFSPAEDAPGGEPVVVLSQALWRRSFGSNPGVVGTSIRVDGEPRTVIGVMPAGFALPEDLQTGDPAELYLPGRIDPADPQWGGHYLNAVGRLRPGVSADQAGTELQAVIESLPPEHRAIYESTNARMLVTPLGHYVVGDVRRALLVLSGAVALVLLIACSNVANLLLARGERRRREVAVRTALGAGRPRIVRQLLTESLLLAGGGAIAGVVGARLATPLLIHLAPVQLPRLGALSLDLSVLAFSLSVSLFVALAVSLVPALQTARLDLAGTLREEGRSASASRRGQRFRRSLVVVEVALTMVLAVGAGLFVRSFARLTSADPAMDAGQALTFRAAISPLDAPDMAQVDRLFRRMVDRIRQVPGVEAAGTVSSVPLSGSMGDALVDVEGGPSLAASPNGADSADHYTQTRWVSPGYFEALGIPVLRGRTMERADVDSGRPVVVVNRAFQERYFPDGDAIGRHLRTYLGLAEPQEWREIVGVVAGAPIARLGEAPLPEIYTSIDGAGPDAPVRARSFLVRAAGDPAALTASLTRAVHEVSPHVPVYDVETMASVVERSVARPRFTLWMMGTFAVLALLLAAVGLYGVMAYSVSARTHEIGVRVALGARQRSVLSLVLREAMTLTGIGLALGTAGALALSRTLSSLLHEVRPDDPATYAVVLAVLTGATLLASLLPARQAARVDPKVALGEE